MYNGECKEWFENIMANNPIVPPPYSNYDTIPQERYKNNPMAPDRPNNHPVGDSQGDMMLLISWYDAGQNWSLFKE
jgi:hypothetical protein